MTRRSLRILVPNFAAPDSFTDNVVHTLRAMGHQVQSIDRPVWRDRGKLRRILHDSWAGYRPQTWTGQERWVVETARACPPDLVIALTIPLREEVLIELKKLNVTATVAWWGDSPANMRGMGLLANGWDRIYIKDATAVAKFQALGLPADYLHEAMNPDWHRPVKELDHSATGAVVVAGSYYGYRQAIVERLAKVDVPLALYGPPPPRWSSSAVSSGYRGRYITKVEKSRAFSAGIACLNSTSLSEGNSLNCRAFEVCGAGGLQLIEDKPVVSECFESETEVLTYKSVEEICDHLDRARRDPAWALTVRENGYNRALAHHTYRHRLDHILSDLDFI